MVSIAPQRVYGHGKGNVMTDILERLRNWEKVYPEDAYKIDGHLYAEAADEIERLRGLVAELERDLEKSRFAAIGRKTSAEMRRDRAEAHAEAAEAEIEGLLARVKSLDDALRKLDKAASEVARYGAQTGPQWSNLTIASLKARAALKGGK